MVSVLKANWDKYALVPIDGRPTRSLSELLFKALAIITTTTTAARHLTTLRSISSKHRADTISLVAGFLILPTLPLASLLCNSWHTIRVALRDRRDGGSFSYYICAALGMEAVPSPGSGKEKDKSSPTRNSWAREDSELSIRLYRCKYSSLQVVRKAYDRKWFARFTVLLLFEAQAMATVLLFIRRINAGAGPSGHTVVAALDVYSGLLAFGGSITGLWSIAITSLNYSWTLQTSPPREWPIPWPETTFRKIVNWIYSLSDEDSPYRTKDIAVELGTARFMLLCLIFLGIKVVEPTPQFWFPFAFGLIKKGGDVDVGIVILAMAYTILICGLVATFWFFLNYLFDGSDLALVWGGPLISAKMFISSYCFVSMGYLAHHVSDEIKRVQLWQERGLWLDVMWVDPLGAKLYVF